MGAPAKPVETVQLRFLSNHGDVKNRKVTDGKDMVVVKRGTGPGTRVTVREFISSSKYSDLGTPRDRLSFITAKRNGCVFSTTSRSGKIKVNVRWASPRPVARSLRSFTWAHTIKNACRAGRKEAEQMRKSARDMICKESASACALHDTAAGIVKSRFGSGGISFCKGVE